MSFTHYSPEAYQPILADIYQVIDLGAIGNPWKTTKQFLNPYLLHMLHMFAESIPSDGNPIDEDELNSIRDKLLLLLDRIIKSALPVNVKRFLVAQINILLNAILDYPIRGSTVFVEGISQSMAEYHLNKDLIESQKNSKEFNDYLGDIGEAWKWVREQTENVEALLGCL